jgi:putative NADH-flavin reductase
MKLFILGATGGIGSALIDQACARGHTVTAFVRSPQKIAGTDPRLTVVTGDPRNAQQLASAMRGHDAVLSALGSRSLMAHGLLRDCARSTVAAMQAASVDRLVIVSAAALFPDAGLLAAILRRTLLASAMDDAAAMEKTVMGDGLEWTIARPPRLTDGGGTGHYRAVTGHPASSALTIDRADVARFMLDAADRELHVREIVGVGR